MTGLHNGDLLRAFSVSSCWSACLSVSCNVNEELNHRGRYETPRFIMPVRDLFFIILLSRLNDWYLQRSDKSSESGE